MKYTSDLCIMEVRNYSQRIRFLESGQLAEKTQAETASALPAGYGKNTVCIVVAGGFN